MAATRGRGAPLLCEAEEGRWDRERTHYGKLEASGMAGELRRNLEWGSWQWVPSDARGMGWAADVGPEKGASGAGGGGREGAGGARAEKGASKAVAKWRTGQWLTRGRGSQVGCPDRGEGRDQRVKLTANRTAPQSRRYSHSRSSGLDLAKKVSSTLALTAAALGCAVGALPIPG